MKNSKIYIYNPISADNLSKVRGIGRFTQILQDIFSPYSTVISNQDDIMSPGVVINPYFSLIKENIKFKKNVQNYIPVVLDLIPLKYPEHFPTGILSVNTIFDNSRILRSAPFIVSISRSVKSDLICDLGINPEKITPIHLCLTSELRLLINKTKQIESEQPYFIYVGDGTWNKNLLNLALAIKKVNIRLVVVGESFTRKRVVNSWNKDLNAFLKLTSNDPLFQFEGFVENKRLVSLYKGAVSNVLVSRDEGFGLSYLEAAACSTPSVLSHIPVFKEIAGNSAYYVDPENNEKIAAGLIEMYLNKEKRDFLSIEALNQSKKYSLDKIQEKWFTLVEKVSSHSLL